MGGAPYDERNAEDFRELTERLEAGLKKIGADSGIPATEAALCKLARCSRGTLRHRKWPLERLKAIKAKRKQKAGEKDKGIPGGVEDQIEGEERLEDRLKKSRTEAAVWFHKFKDEEKENQRLRRANAALQTARQRLQAQLDEARGELLRLRPDSEQGRAENVVVPFPQADRGGKPADV